MVGLSVAIFAGPVGCPSIPHLPSSYVYLFEIMEGERMHLVLIHVPVLGVHVAEHVLTTRRRIYPCIGTFRYLDYSRTKNPFCQMRFHLGG